MTNQNTAFQVEDNRFWILERRKSDEEIEQEEFAVDAWVFQEEETAISHLRELITEEDIDTENLDDETIEELGNKYNLQHVEIAEEQYNVRAESWLKIALRMGVT